MSPLIGEDPTFLGNTTLAPSGIEELNQNDMTNLADSIIMAVGSMFAFIVLLAVVARGCQEPRVRVSPTQSTETQQERKQMCLATRIRLISQRLHVFEWTGESPATTTDTKTVTTSPPPLATDDAPQDEPSSPEYKEEHEEDLKLSDTRSESSSSDTDDASCEMSITEESFPSPRLDEDEPEGDVETGQLSNPEAEEEEEEADVCAICLSEFRLHDLVCDSENAACKHVFHATCMVSWLSKQSECPICRQEFLSLEDEKV